MKKLLLSLLFSVAIANLYGQQSPPLEVIFSLDGGFYDTAMNISLHAAPNARIFYTLDGSQPNSKTKRYRKAIPIKETTVVRAIAFLGTESSPINSQTYFLNEPSSTFPTLSISIDPWRLFDSEQGLFMLGSKADMESTRMSGANFWSRKEVSAGLEFYESDGTCVHNSGIGLRLFGGISRLAPQKSLALVSRETYGEKKIRYPVFGKSGPKSFKYLVLRNSGSDFGKTHARDAIMTHLVKDWEVETQAYRPAHVYLNGKYWGIYNIREKINKHFLASHFDVDKDSLDLLEHNMTLKKGSRRKYQELIHFLHNNDLKDGSNYLQVLQWVDIESFMDWQIAQIFFDNRDAGGNIRYWRPQTEEGRWRWILYDLDWGMGLHNSDAYQFNSLDFHSNPDGPDWPNPPWSTFLFRKLLENEAFQQAFITRFSDYLNTDISEEQTLAIIEEFQQNLRSEIGRHSQRWNLSEAYWEKEFDRLRSFAKQRADFVREHMKDYFSLGELSQLEVEVNQGGNIIINRHVVLEAQHFDGTYFRDFPIHLRAEPHLGYRFSHWEDETGNIINDETLLFKLSQDVHHFRAVFESYKHPLLGALVINEIAPNNKKSKDWVELFNRTNERIALGGFVLRDQKGHAFHFPDGAYIGPKDYLILAQKKEQFLKSFPESYNVIGDLGFGVNKHKESLELFDNYKAAIDSVAYVLEPTDSIFSMGLLLPKLNNGDPENWQVGIGTGTPNAANPYYVESSVKVDQTWWIRISVGLAVFILMASIIYYQWKD